MQPQTQTQHQKFKVNDRVRISIHKGLFEKGSTVNWSEEIFEIANIVRQTRPVVYQIKDLAGNLIKGGFYEEQLQKTAQKVYRIEKVLRRRKDSKGMQEVLVRWSGYSNKFDSWIPASDILHSGNI